MQYVIGSVLALATVALAVGAITSRVKIRSCCAAAEVVRLRLHTSWPAAPAGLTEERSPETRGDIRLPAHDLAVMLRVGPFGAIQQTQTVNASESQS